MELVWGSVLVLLGALAWGGQTVSWLSPAVAARFGLAEAEETVEPAFWADIRGEAMWDAVTLWTLPLAGILLIADSSAWRWWGLVGGAIYLYFGGRGVAARIEMRRRSLRAGTEAELRAAFVMLPVWAIAGLVTVVAAVRSL